MTNGQILEEIYARVIKSGEIPYQANRKASQAFDVFRDDERGLDELLVVLGGIDSLITNLKEFKNGAQTIVEKARDSLR